MTMPSSVPSFPGTPGISLNCKVAQPEIDASARGFPPRYSWLKKWWWYRVIVGKMYVFFVCTVYYVYYMYICNINIYIYTHTSIYLYVILPRYFKTSIPKMAICTRRHRFKTIILGVPIRWRMFLLLGGRLCRDVMGWGLQHWFDELWETAWTCRRESLGKGCERKGSLLGNSERTFPINFT